MGWVWGVPACFVLPTPSLSAGAGLGNLAALVWPRTHFLSNEQGLGWFLRSFRPAEDAICQGMSPLGYWQKSNRSPTQRKPYNIDPFSPFLLQK